MTQQALRYLMEHPGAVHRSPQRTRYSDGFRCFVLELAEHSSDLELAELADAIEVPLGTLKDWLGGGHAHIDAPAEPPNLATAPDPVTEPRIASILHAYQHWQGDFVAFCTHVQHHLRIPFGITLIRDILQAEGVRVPRRRGRRSAEERALRDQFETFMAGDQWVGDGSPIDVWVAGERYTFNLELMVDPATGAFVGASLRDTEDAQAVIEALEDGVATTGEAPMAVLLDNRPSNHTDDVVDALGDTMKIRATSGRAQNKAHCEGGFGLFQQMAPELRMDSLQLRDVARRVLDLVVTTWARTLNHRPRADRGGQSRVELYESANPTEEQRAAAREALVARLAKQERARKTLRARLDPVLKSTLDDAFDKLDLADPDGHFRAALATFPIAAVVAGLAIFFAKKRAGTLPDGVDARYLIGIVKNVTNEEEGMAIAEALWQERERFRDRAFALLHDTRDRLEEDAEDTLDLIRRLTDHALATNRKFDRVFWVRAIADVISDEEAAEHRRLFLITARRIHATHKVPYRDRNAIVRRLAALLRPIE
ncbi:MAG: hypothetical protein JRI25_16925 [Deltaproteobacteria bacterium]|nr:hypothetical protein [Deltaproteobacteria bacterium]MBW2256261.1 hypothetical protein [Deltaproteobacteria bacterium]